MIRYRHDPNRPGEPIIEASPRELDGYRDFIRGYLVKTWSVLGDDDVEDIAQDTLIALCRIVGEGRGRGVYTTSPEDVIKRMASAVAWRLARNLRKRSHNRHPAESLDEDIDIPDPGALPDQVVEARSTLERILESDARATRVLVLFAAGSGVAEIAQAFGVQVTAVWPMISRARKKLCS
ncbi:sigma-70 family RNA polymerase sigma factor [Polyangium sp. 6x1]|uniref:RNA polymerase sigma factor n=1 Tax=Polyangium sp. 6x1 TaxID=3042689 RepID=UPI002482E020|nr:sigma-70 family RNA polymerase sigma factor [Polyangium sp. 6x1]MDI1445948.1 sigma-70 family RNA polymerase sigma factor [Polyangium sp. 6x1]